MNHSFTSGAALSQTEAVWAVAASLRRATIILAADRSGLKESLDRCEPVSIGTVDATSARILRAGTILGVFQCDKPGSYSWSSDYKWVPRNSSCWNQLIAIICHQLSYLNLVESPDFWREGHRSPAVQLANEPARYHSFLSGVAASHRQHAAWLSQIDELQQCRSMADLGGGLGTYAEAWVASSNTRMATIVDLPGVGEFLTDLMHRYDGQLKFIGADLNDPFALAEPVDFVLFANVLHLVPTWPELLGRAVHTSRHGCLIGVFEADPGTPQGTLFDLQVHLRSGRLTGLLDPALITNVLAQSGLRDVRRLSMTDPEDPFQRQYGLWIGEVAKTGGEREM